jgi:hypothetical protein
MSLAQAISQADAKALADLAAYVAKEVALEGRPVAKEGEVDIDPEAVIAAMRAWAFMQIHQPDGDA